MKRNIVITGANRGLGFAMLEAFAKNGNNIWACVRSSNLDYQKKINDIAKLNNVWIEIVCFDLSNPDEIRRGFNQICQKKQNVDVLINNAGLGHLALFQMTKTSDIRKIFEVNLFAMMELSQLMLRVMIRQKSGYILNIASTSAHEVYVGNSIYGASKAAIVAFTRSLAAEVAGMGINVNALSPGLSNTDMSRVFEGNNPREPLRRSAIGRKIEPEEIADVAVKIVCNDLRIINGQDIVVNGGSK